MLGGYLRESFNNTCFPTSEEYLSFVVSHKEKWNCSKAPSLWDERESGSTLYILSSCSCLCDCKAWCVHMCTFVFEYLYAAMCFVFVWHQGRLTETYDGTQRLKVQRRKLIEAGEKQKHKRGHWITHVAICIYSVYEWENVHSRAYNGMCWSFVNAVCFSWEGFAEDSSEHTTGFLSSLNTWGEESA